MKLSAWRIVSPRWSERAFDGEGARRYGGRWNPVGTRMVYCSEHRSLAILEILVHLPAQMAGLEFHLYEVSFEASLAEQLNIHKLPGDWNAPFICQETQQLGADWQKKAKSPVLKVPSALVPGEYNYLLNPMAADFRKLSFEGPVPFALDPRLLK